jgi:BirA family biotin operon repressor/biotin-[acetyl-CoA-carboxylase] ligase
MSARPPLLPFTAEALAAALAPGAFGRPLEFHLVVDSTNRCATDRARDGSAEGLVAIADAQTAGRGRLGRPWESPPGVGVYLSVLLRPAVDAEAASFLTSVAALATCDVVEETIGERAGIKWPNDVVVGGRKVAGILAEGGGTAGAAWVVMGIGVNVNQRPGEFSREVGETATSLRALRGDVVCRVRVVAGLLAGFERAYRTFLSGGAAALMERVRRASLVLGHRVEIEGGPRRVVGVALDLDDRGGLVVGKGGGRETFYSGRITRIWT